MRWYHSKHKISAGPFVQKFWPVQAMQLESYMVKKKKNIKIKIIVTFDQIYLIQFENDTVYIISHQNFENDTVYIISHQNFEESALLMYFCILPHPATFRFFFFLIKILKIIIKNAIFTKTYQCYFHQNGLKMCLGYWSPQISVYFSKCPPSQTMDRGVDVTKKHKKSSWSENWQRYVERFFFYFGSKSKLHHKIIWLVDYLLPW